MKAKLVLPILRETIKRLSELEDSLAGKYRRKINWGDLDTGTAMSLHRAGYDYWEEIAETSDAELLRLPSVGKWTVKKIRAAQNLVLGRNEWKDKETQA